MHVSYAFREIALIMNSVSMPTLGNHDQSVQSESISYLSAFAVTCVAILVSACSPTLPVQDTMHNFAETITGSTTETMGGATELHIVSSRGSICNGGFNYVTSREGNGVFACSDGRTGPFHFVSTGTHGAGYGSLEGQNFTFRFGSQ